MTVIVGVVSNGHVYFGADSKVSSPHALVRPNLVPKVWAQGEMVFGLSGRVREQQILRYLTEIPDCAVGDLSMAWVCGPFIDSIRHARKAAGVDERIDGQGLCEYGPVMMVGFRGRLFALHGDYSVAEYPNGGAIGSGEAAAWGSLHTTSVLGADPMQRIMLALEAACAHDLYCGGPFSFATTDPKWAQPCS